MEDVFDHMEEDYNFEIGQGHNNNHCKPYSNCILESEVCNKQVYSDSHSPVYCGDDGLSMKKYSKVNKKTTNL